MAILKPMQNMTLSSREINSEMLSDVHVNSRTAISKHIDTALAIAETPSHTMQTPRTQQDSPTLSFDGDVLIWVN